MVIPFLKFVDPSQTDQIVVHSRSSLTVHPTVVEPITTKESFKVELTLEEGRVIANYSWVYCTLPTGLASKVSQSPFPSWNLTSRTSLPLEYLTDSHTQLIVKVWSSLTETPDPEQDQMYQDMPLTCPLCSPSPW